MITYPELSKCPMIEGNVMADILIDERSDLNIRNQIKLSLENFKKDFLTNISVTGFIENKPIYEVVEN